MVSKPQHTATASALARVNRTTILETLRDVGVLSRQQIVEMTGLSPATVNRLTAALIEQGIVAPAGHEPSTGGRRAILLRYAGDSRVVAALQLTPNRAVGVLVDFDGRIMFRHEMTIGHQTNRSSGSAALRSPEREQELSLKRTLELVDLLLEHAEGMNMPCRAIGVAIPGVVRHPNGVIRNVPGIGWESLELGRILRERSPLPVVIDNDANALAFGQQRRGAGQGVQSLVALVLENGLGAGIITNGKLHRGANAEAGEIGYLLMGKSSLGQTFSEYGDLEGHIEPEALTETARARGLAVPPGELLAASDVFSLASKGDAIATTIVEDILDVIAIAVAAIVTILDPELVVLGGSLVWGTSPVIPGVRERLTGRILQRPRIEAASTPQDAVLLGAAELAISEVSSFTYIAS